MPQVLNGATHSRPIDFPNKKDEPAHNRLVSLVDQMLALHQSLLAAPKAQP